MKRFLWINIKFENLVRIVIATCTFIAIVIICIAFYFVFNNKKIEEDNLNIENFLTITKFDANYEATVYSNKNVHKYNIYESADFIEDNYSIKVENGIEINTHGSSLSIKNENANYVYEDSLDENNLNVISMSYVIKNINEECFMRDMDKDVVFEVEIANNLYKYYEIYVSKKDKKIEKICLYNSDGIVQILIDNIFFEVKK